MERAAGIEPASSAWKAEVIAIIRCPHSLKFSDQLLFKKVVEGAGFEPAKAEPADLQSAPVDRLGTPPEIDGADCRNRTGDLLITSQLLYQLS